MNVRSLALLAAVGLAGAARADVVTLAVPDAYSPATAFTVGVRLSPVSNLGLYNVELVIRSPGAPAGWLAVSPPSPAAGGYVFTTTDNFLGSSVAAGSEYRLTLSDFTLDATGPDVTAGVNDRLATLTFLPSSTPTTPIEVSIDRTSLFVDDAAGDSLQTGGPLPVAVVGPGATEPAPVPAPAGIALAAVAVGVFAVRRWRARPVHA